MCGLKDRKERDWRAGCRLSVACPLNSIWYNMHLTTNAREYLMSVSTYPTSLLISQLATALHAVMKYSAVISVCAWPARINDDGKAVCGSQLFTEVFVKGFEDIGVYSAELIYDAELIGGHYDEGYRTRI